MNNRKVLIDALKKLGAAKAPTNKKDIIVDPNGQWAHPGEVTRIPSNTITMSGVPYPVLGKPNVGEPQMMYPGQDYQFPDADYVDEFPMQQGKQLVKKSLGGLTRFTGSAGKMMSLPPIVSTVANSAPAILNSVNNISQNLPNINLDQATKNLLQYPNFNVALGESNLTIPNLPKYLGGFDFKDFSDGWEARNAMMQSYAGPQWAPTKDDFYTDDEVIDLFQKEVDYRNAWNQFDEMYPEEPGMNIMRGLSGDTSRDELFANLYPGVYMPNFRSKFLSPEQSAILSQKGLYNPTFSNKGMLNKSSLNSLTKGEDTLPRSYKELLKLSDEENFLNTADPKMIANEFRGMLKLKTDDINNATPKQLELWRRQVISQMRTQALDRWNAETGNPLTGNDAYGQFFNRPGARNKEGGAVKYEEGGETPTEFVSAKEGVDTPIYKQVSVKKSKIAGKGLFTNEPIQMGEPIGVSHIRKVFNKDGEMYQAPFPSTVLGYYNHSEEPNVKEVDNGDHIVMVATRDIKPNEELTSNYDISGIKDLETTANFKKGGSAPKMPKKKSPRSYSRSLEATNRLLAEHPFFAEPKSRKNKIYDPNAKYFQDGGENNCEDGRCLETDQAQELLDKADALRYKSLNTMWDVANQTNPENGKPKNAAAVWGSKGVKTLESRLGVPNPANCMWAAGSGYQCLPETKGKMPLVPFESNDKFINAVNKGSIPFRRVGVTQNPNFATDEANMLRPGDIINMKGPNTSHALTFSHYNTDGSPVFLHSDGSPSNFEWNQGLIPGMVPGKSGIKAYVSRLDPEALYRNEINQLEEKARTNPTYYQEGGENDEEAEGTSQDNFLRNWFVNRQMPTAEGQKLLEKVRPEAIERSSQKVPYIMTDTLPDNVAGYYDTEDENIYLNQAYPPDQLKSTKYHEKLHYVQDGDKFYKVLDTPHQYLVEQNIKAPEEINTGNPQWDANIKANYDDIVPQEEMHARIMTLRRLAGFQPDQVITEEMLNNYFNSVKESGKPLDPDIEDLRGVTKGNSSIVNLLNDMVSVPQREQNMTYAQDGGGLELELTPEEIQEYAKGGYIIEDISVPELTKASYGKIVKAAASSADDISNIVKGQGNVTNLLKLTNRAITPIGYGVLQKAVAAPFNLISPYQPKTYNLKNRYDAWNIYNQMAPKNNGLTVNPDGTVSITDYEISRDLLDSIKNSENNFFNTVDFNDEFNEGNPINFGGVHGNGHAFKGIDEEGRKYIDFTDTWDLHPLQKSFFPEAVRNFEFGSLTGAKPFALRNRIYYDDEGNYFDHMNNPLSQYERDMQNVSYHTLAKQIQTSPNGVLPESKVVKRTFLTTPNITENEFNLSESDWDNAANRNFLYNAGALGTGIGLGMYGAYKASTSNEDEIKWDPKTKRYKFVTEKKYGGELPKASYGMITKAAGKLAKVPKSSSAFVRGTTTILPKIPPTSIQLGKIPADFDIKNVTLPFSIADSKDKGYLTLHAYPGKRGMDGNTFHFLANMDSPLESGRAFNLMNESFTKPNPVILEPFSLSVDSLNTLLNMGRRPDWTLSYEDHLPLNYLTKHSNLFEGLQLPKGFRTMAPLSDETSTEMLTRLNNLLQEKGMTEQARIVNVPGGPMKEIRVPNYKLTRNYSQGGSLPKAANGLILKPGQLLRSSIYKGINPASYAIAEKVMGIPNELLQTATNNATRPYRVGLSLKYGHQPFLETHLKTQKVPLADFKKMSDREQMQLFSPSTLSQLEDVGKRRLDAWAVGLGLPQEYGTLEQIGDNKFRMLNTEYSPMYFNELYNDLRALRYENTLTAGHNPLEDLTREAYKIKLQQTYENPQELAERMKHEDSMRILGYNPWQRERHAKLNPLPFSGIETGSVWDNDSYGVMGGFRWDINNNDQGLQFTTSDVWDLNPWEKRGHAYLNPSATAKQIAASSFFKPLQNVEALKLVGGKPFLIENNFVIDPKTYKTLDSWEDGGNIDYELGDEVDEATMRELEKLGYTFEKL